MSEEQKKEVSSLKFSDFENAGMKFNHEATSIMEALGIGESEYEQMKNCMIETSKGATSFSTHVERILKCDAPTSWKVIGLIKAGEAIMSAKVSHSITKAPDDLPVPILKAMILMSTMGGI